jgi:hypothetical protein
MMRARAVIAVSVRSGLGLIILAGAMLAGEAPAWAQSAESEPPPARGTFKIDPLPPPAKPFLVPDVPQPAADRAAVAVAGACPIVGLLLTRRVERERRRL